MSFAPRQTPGLALSELDSGKVAEGREGRALGLSIAQANAESEAGGSAKESNLPDAQKRHTRF